jgi:hypothetical protein
MFDILGSVPTPTPPIDPAFPFWVDEYASPIITAPVFSMSMEDPTELVLFVYASLECDRCREQLEIWEEASITLRAFVKAARVNASADPSFAKMFGCPSYPCVVSVCPSRGSFKTRRLGQFFNSDSEILAALFEGRRLPPIVEGNDAYRTEGQWFSAVTVPGPQPIAHLRYIAYMLGPRFRYARVHFPISIFDPPTVQVIWRDRPTFLEVGIRRGAAHVIHIEARGRSWLAIASECVEPAFVELNRRNYDRVCQEFCIAVVTPAMDNHLIQRFGLWGPRIARLSPSSPFAKRVRATADDRVIFVRGKAWKVPAHVQDGIARTAIKGLEAGLDVQRELVGMREVDISDLIVFVRRDKYWIGGVSLAIAVLWSCRTWVAKTREMQR